MQSAEQLPEDKRQGALVLTELPISPLALDSIEGVERIDWLILDELSDAVAILQHGEQALKDSLLIEVRIAFQRTHQRQPSLDEISDWASRHGFRFERLGHRSHFPKRHDLKKKQSTELVSAGAYLLAEGAISPPPADDLDIQPDQDQASVLLAESASQEGSTTPTSAQDDLAEFVFD